MTSRRIPTWASIALVTSMACAGRQTVDVGNFEDFAWPPGNPRVRLERVLRQENSTAGGRLLNWIGGGNNPSLFERPYGVAWAGNDLLVTDPGARRVLLVEARGKVKASADGAFENPIGLAACASGFVVTDANRGTVTRVSSDLEQVEWVADGLDRPTGVACDGDRIFVVETGEHCLTVFEPDGSRTRIGGRGGGPGEFNYPTSVAFVDGRLLVGDTLNFRLQRLDATSGAFETTFGHLGDAAGEMPRIKGIAVDRAGHTWVSDAYLDTVSLYTSSGELLMSLGGTGAEPGRFSFPAGIASHPDGRVAVVDSLNQRVQIFRILATSKDLEVTGASDP